MKDIFNEEQMIHMDALSDAFDETISEFIDN